MVIIFELIKELDKT